jgi:uncharacterized SAM-binding protein YcdF (DUF218 family)
VILSVLRAPAVDTLDMPSQKDQSMGIRTWLCFIMPAPLIVYIARTTILKSKRIPQSRYQPKSLPVLWIKKPPASVISEAIQHHKSSMP